jgi:hypothetical protein
MGRKIFTKTDNLPVVKTKKWYGGSTSRDSSAVSNKINNISIGKMLLTPTTQPKSYYSKDPIAVNRVQ